MELTSRLMGRAHVAVIRLRRALREERAQGTTEYAILVGVLVVVAIAAITAIGPIVSDLWSSIEDGMKDIDV